MATAAERAKLAAFLKPKKRSKYGAKRSVVDGMKFDSKKESERYCELMVLQKAGEISHLRRQPRFELRAEGGEIVGYYIADFQYVDVRKDAVVNEDVKGGDATKTQLYEWKKRHVKAQYGFEIKEV